jgi:hypothetical protein
LKSNKNISHSNILLKKLNVHLDKHSLDNIHNDKSIDHLNLHSDHEKLVDLNTIDKQNNNLFNNLSQNLLYKTKSQINGNNSNLYSPTAPTIKTFDKLFADKTINSKRYYPRIIHKSDLINKNLVESIHKNVVSIIQMLFRIT